MSDVFEDFKQLYILAIKNIYPDLLIERGEGSQIGKGLFFIIHILS